MNSSQAPLGQWLSLDSIRRGVKRARAVVHTTALRNRVSAFIPSLTTLSTNHPDTLTISAVRSKLKLSHVPTVAAAVTPEPDAQQGSTASLPPTPADMPPVPPKDFPPSPQMLATPSSEVSEGTSNYFSSASVEDEHLQQPHSPTMPYSSDGLMPQTSLQSRRRTPSPIQVPTAAATPTLNIDDPPSSRAQIQEPQEEDEEASPSFLSYLQNGSAPASPVESMHPKPEQKPLPLSPLSPHADGSLPPLSPRSNNTTDDLIDQYARTSPRGVPDSYVPEETIPEEPREPEAQEEHSAPTPSLPRSESDNIKLAYQLQSERQSSNTVTALSRSTPPSQTTSSNLIAASEAAGSVSPPCRSSSLMRSLASTNELSYVHHREQLQHHAQTHQHRRGLSNASSTRHSAKHEPYTESITTSASTATGDSSSSALASSHQKSRDAALEAELKRQAAWEADTPRRKTLPVADQIDLERNELERRTAAERQRKEMQWRHAMAQQEMQAVEDAERKAKEEVERKEREQAEEEARAARAEQARLEAEERRQRAVEAKQARQAQLKSQLQQLSLVKDEEGSTMLDGFVSVQQPNSTLWRRRWFQLRPRELQLFKSSEVRR